MQTVKTARDHRIDALRGLALIMMYVDHIPEDLLNRFTMRNVGFADAAEIFVLLAGYASWLAYGRKVNQDGMLKVYKRIVHRCWKIYLYQMGLVLMTLFSIYQWRRFFTLSADFLEPELAHGYGIIRVLWRLIIMEALPSNLNILPLYIVLLMAFPVLIFLMRLRYWLAFFLSFILWLTVNINPGINFPNWLDPDGWFFNPLAWQFLFVIGFYGARWASQHQGSFPAVRSVQIIALIYLIFSFFEAFPWQFWGLNDFRIVSIPMPEKAYLSPLRLLDVMAIFYLIQSLSVFKKWSENR
ncbi:OpgC domain-containing protein, partial [Commensalibacter sp. Nvir]|uniref:OpgC family protein n=1 Tax=Commensalibacter sp. Nvir TaxID=3069817 RepID=UPI0030C7CF45